ncbi:hypothetical protein HPB50_010555 [Hyalomma asiaticum]|uniref:Uncharacterized protein n=1 Tax=Hyalomma asiaticum TaxID=266040 RepID=A0ACB7TFF0_HYAAI|nr:hypothetical protein HPB50_010555 [Hyalomma asiaticum]
MVARNCGAATGVEHERRCDFDVDDGLHDYDFDVHDGRYAKISSVDARCITADLTKHHYVVSGLSPPTANEIRDFVLQPLVEKAYATLKETLIRRVTTPNRSDYSNCFATQTSATVLPVSCCGACIYCRRNNTVHGALFRELFLQKLPSNVRWVVAASEQKVLPLVAELADQLMAIATPTSVAAMRAQQVKTNFSECVKIFLG